MKTPPSLYVERLKINLKNIYFFFHLYYLFIHLSIRWRRRFILQIFDYLNIQDPKIGSYDDICLKSQGKMCFLLHLQKQQNGGGVQKDKKIKYNWWYCLIRQKMRIKKTISELLEVSIELWPKPRNLKKRVKKMFNQDERKTECAVGNREMGFWQGKKAENIFISLLTSGSAVFICLLLLVLPNSNNLSNHVLFNIFKNGKKLHTLQLHTFSVYEKQ